MMMLINNIFFFFIMFVISYFFFSAYIKNFFLFTIYVTEKLLNKSGTTKIPTGVGILFLPISTISFILHTSILDKIILPVNFLYFVLSLFFISIVSFFDDKYNLDPRIRLICQSIACYVGLSCILYSEFFFQINISILVSIIVWIYIINITNFIDGADNFCLANLIFFFLSSLLLILFFDLEVFSKYLIIWLIPIFITFSFFFNWPLAKCYMGDSGSIFCGFVTGFIILEFFFNGFYLYPLAFYSYAITDCTLTLIKKTLKGYLPWARLSDYYFLKIKLKEKNYNDEFKILYYFLGHSFINFIIIGISIYFKLEVISLLCFLSSYILTQVYKRRREI
jgi:UDP-N-acetylmuramyl pentapeptide phosphotransferase/UDP-N-acetylglucosamine-1-phosphate transferase